MPRKGGGEKGGLLTREVTGRSWQAAGRIKGQYVASHYESRKGGIE